MHYLGINIASNLFLFGFRCVHGVHLFPTGMKVAYSWSRSAMRRRVVFFGLGSTGSAEGSRMAFPGLYFSKNFPDIQSYGEPCRWKAQRLFWSLILTSEPRLSPVCHSGKMLWYKYCSMMDNISLWGRWVTCASHKYEWAIHLGGDVEISVFSWYIAHFGAHILLRGFRKCS